MLAWSLLVDGGGGACVCVFSVGIVRVGDCVLLYEWMMLMVVVVDWRWMNACVCVKKNTTITPYRIIVWQSTKRGDREKR